MKKLLALVLALVMTMGLATVGTSAAFADAASIEHSEAVEVLNALGVVGGKENNNFDPTANVKRSEMAKMVTIAMLGDVDVSAFAGAPTDLTDINGHWAEGYIKYCYSQGIIGGRGNGQFDPDANVTATEAAKMMLVAIGYDASVQGYGGDQWKVNVVRDAQLSGFYTDLKGLTVDKVLTRDETAQLVYNAMDADLIVKKPTLNVSTGTIQYTYEKNGNGEDLLGNIFKAYTFEGTLNQFSYDSNKAQWTLTVAAKDASQVDPSNVTATVAAGTAEAFKIDSDVTGLFKQNVKVLFTLDSKGKLDKAVGVYPSDSEVLVSHVIDKIDVPNSTAKTLRVDGKDYDLDNAASQTLIYEYYYNDTNTFAYKTRVDTIATNYVAADGERAAYMFSLIDNDGDGKGNVIVVSPKAVAKVDSLSGSYVTLKFELAETSLGASKTLKLADVDAYSGMAKGDYVYATPDVNTATNRWLIEKAEVQTGTVSATRTNEEQIGGTWLKSNFVTTATAGDEVNYVALNGFIAWQEGASKTGADKFVVVLANATSNNNKIDDTYTTKLLFSDGSKKTVEVKSVNQNSGSGGTTELMKSRMYTYKMDGDNYRLYDVNSTYVGASDSATTSAYTKTSYDVVAFQIVPAANTYTYVYGDASGYVGTVDTTTSVARVKDSSGNIYTIADDAVIFVYKQASSDVTVTTGAQLKKSNNTNTTKVVFLAADKNSSTGFYEIQFAYVYDSTGISTKSTYAVALSDGYVEKLSNGKYVGKVDVWDGTSKVTLTSESKDSATGNIVEVVGSIGAKKAFRYTLTSGGAVDTVNGSSSAFGTVQPGGTTALAITAYESGSMVTLSNQVFVKQSPSNTITYGNGGVYTTYTYTISEDTEIFYVNFGASPAEGVSSGSVAVAFDDTVENVMGVANNNSKLYFANAMMVVDKDNPTEVGLLVVDISGDTLGIQSK